MLETELYEPVREYFENLGYRVNSEVKNCDVTAVKDEEIVIVELKTAFNLKLIIQAAKRQRLTDNVFVALPKPQWKKLCSKDWKDKMYLLRRLEVGLIFISFKGKKPTVEVQLYPEPFDREKSKQVSSRKKAGVVKEIRERQGDYNVGGSVKTKLVTAYRQNSVFIACCLKKYGQLSTRKLRELGTGDKTTSILYDNYYGWFDRVSRGVYVLTDKGEKALEKYPGLVKTYMNSL